MRDLINIIEQEETVVQFREHRGSLTDSMETLQTFKTKADLVRYLQGAVNPEIEASDLEIEEYAGPDPRIGWMMTYIVLLDGMPIGFTDKLFPETIHEATSVLSEERMTWEPFSVPVTITLNLITHASSQEEAHRFVQESLSGIEINPGFGNGEQLKIDGGINAVIDHSSALRENAPSPGLGRTSRDDRSPPSSR